jgi:hypothetical protein
LRGYCFALGRMRRQGGLYIGILTRHTRAKIFLLGKGKMEVNQSNVTVPVRLPADPETGDKGKEEPKVPERTPDTTDDTQPVTQDVVRDQGAVSIGGVPHEAQ